MNCSDKSTNNQLILPEHKSLINYLEYIFNKNIDNIVGLVIFFKVIAKPKTAKVIY